jgi:hypothetical protein
VAASNESFALSVDKSERATNKLLDQQADNQKTTAGALEDKITGLKERLDRIEGAAVGTITAKSDVAQAHGVTVSTITAIVAVAGLIIVLAERLLR